jgi:hypothetical protein
LIGYFVVFEVQMYKSSEGKMRMQFVLLTPFLSLTSTCSTWTNAIVYFKNGRTLLNELNAPDTILNIMTAAAHVYLLYLRTQGLFATSVHLAKSMKILGIIFAFLSVFNVFLGILVFLETVFPQINMGVTDWLFVSATIIMAFFLIMIDSISTYVFGKQVSKQNQIKQKLVRNEDMQIIARMGLSICILSITIFVFYTTSYASSTASFQDIGAAGFILTGNCIAGLWIIMKIRVDNLKNKRSSVEPHCCLKWIQECEKSLEVETNQSPSEALLSSDHLLNTTESGNLPLQLSERKPSASK